MKNITSLLSVVVVAGAGIGAAGCGNSKETKFTREEISNKNLYLIKINGDWCLKDQNYSPVFKIVKAITFDGDVDQGKIALITPDGDAFQLKVEGKTRHAKYLVVKPY